MSLTGNPNPAPVICNCLVLRQAARRVTQLYDQALAPEDIRITQFPILALLRADGTMLMKDLAAKLVMDRATLGHNLRPLEARGLVAIAPGKDRRGRMVSLTDEGAALLRRAAPLWRAAQQRFEEGIGRDDAQALRAALGRVAHADYGP